LPLASYPRQFHTRDGRPVVVRSLTPEDEPAVAGFIRGLPQNERIYFWDDPSDPDTLHNWLMPSPRSRVVPLVAMDDGRIVALWTLTHESHSWTRHLAHIWGVVEPSLRRSGIGTLMVRELLAIAGSRDVERVALELIRPQKGQIAHFTHLGFEVTAILRDWVKDPKGIYHDMVVISMAVEPAWQKMEDLVMQADSQMG